GLGDPAAAGRELLAAHQLLRVDSTVDDRLFIARERAVLALHGMDGTVARTVLDAIGEQARQLWQVRLQRLAMLRQAMEREALEAEHARTESALLRDPLTGLGNRLRFDRIMAAVDAGSWDRPTSLRGPWVDHRGRGTRRTR